LHARTEPGTYDDKVLVVWLLNVMLQIKRNSHHTAVLFYYEIDPFFLRQKRGRCRRKEEIKQAKEIFEIKNL
jgi:hypothetical protein